MSFCRLHTCFILSVLKLSSICSEAALVLSLRCSLCRKSSHSFRPQQSLGAKLLPKRENLSFGQASWRKDYDFGCGDEHGVPFLKEERPIFLWERESFPAACSPAWAHKCSAKWDQYSNICIHRNRGFLLCSLLMYDPFLVTFCFSLSLVSLSWFPFVFRHRERRVWKLSWIPALCWEAQGSAAELICAQAPFSSAAESGWDRTALGHCYNRFLSRCYSKIFQSNVTIGSVDKNRWPFHLATYLRKQSNEKGGCSGGGLGDF